MFYPAMEEKTLALTWHCDVGHACCSTAAEQMQGLWMVLRETTDNLLHCHLPISLFFHFPPSPNPMKYKTNSMAVKKMCWLYFLLVSTHFRAYRVWILAVYMKFRLWLFERCTVLIFVLNLSMFLMYTQLLMSWREKMLCPVLGWPYMRLAV